MTVFEHIVHCEERIGSIPQLSRAIMGNMAFNLLCTGFRLQKVLEGISDTPLFRRTMATLNTGIGIDKSTGVYRESSDGSPIYDFNFMDQILDVIVNPKSTLFFGLSFMPEDLSSGSSDVVPERWVRSRFPPKDYDRWYDLLHAMVLHALDRYGERAISKWHWVFWNEPDLRFYWRGTQEEFMKTYDYAASAVKAALPSAKVGGCEPSNPAHPMFKEFLAHCTSGRNYCTGSRGSPLDFITFHMKGGPTGQVGIFSNPWDATDYERRNPSLRHIIESTRSALKTIASIEGTKGLPVFITECDIDWGTGTSIYSNPNMHYRNSEYFAAFQCSMTRRMLDLRAEFPDNPIEATFLDTFYIPGYRIFEGQRTLITGEVIEKPILNALRILGKLGRWRLSVTESQDSPVEVLATATENGSFQIMAVNFNENFDYDQIVSVEIQLQGLPTGSWRCLHYRVDHDHSNAYTIWQSTGRPLIPDEDQLTAILKRQGLELMEPDFTITSNDGTASLYAKMPPQSVSLWMIEKGH